MAGGKFTDIKAELKDKIGELVEEIKNLPQRSRQQVELARQRDIISSSKRNKNSHKSKKKNNDDNDNNRNKSKKKNNKKADKEKDEEIKPGKEIPKNTTVVIHEGSVVETEKSGNKGGRE
jgi:hypothetical protein